ncbi:hypothetical protein AVEN_256929-1 [Araneus ventricosus]|uniref:Uncharacterized protein n=1 Tax=Araneus ventricosus TaxID=182803 RepID=A0A4Y2CG56_ARAVE|nr:hypothetical protein AVEN_256929-1 [Araneus ventricosus]
MDSKNDEIFSPIKNSDEEKNERSSDSFSKFLEGPDAFRKSSKAGFCSDESSMQSGAAVVSEASGSEEIKAVQGPSSLSQHSLLSQENVNEKTLSIKSISSKNSSQMLQDKSAKSEAMKAEVSSSSSILDDALLTRLESSCSLKKVDKADNLQLGSTEKDKDFSDTSLTAKYDQQSEAQYKTERKHTSKTNILQLRSIKKSLQANADIISKASASREIEKTKYPTSLSQCDLLSQVCSVERSVKSESDLLSVTSGSKEIKKTHRPSSSSQRNPLSELRSVESSVQSEAADASEDSGSKEIKKRHQPSSLRQHNPLSQLSSVESSVQSGATVASEASGSKEIKKTCSPSSVNEHNPSPQIQSRIEKMVSDAVESQVDNLQQLMWSQHCSLLKALHETKEDLEHRHASERETLCKIMEELAEENRQLRNAASDHK